jgi:hypothetical protein
MKIECQITSTKFAAWKLGLCDRVFFRKFGFDFEIKRIYNIFPSPPHSAFFLIVISCVGKRSRIQL